MNIDSQFILTFFAALAAGISFIAVVLPIVNRSQKRERYQETIARQRKDIYESQRKEREKREAEEKPADAKSSIEASFKVRQIVGDMADELRSRMHQAGRRSPNATLVFVILRVVLPLGFIVLSMVVMGSMQKDIPDSFKLLIIFAVGWFGFALPGIMLQNDILKRQAEINLAFPDALDMMLVCVQGGISLEQAVNRIAEEIADHSRTLSEELGQLGAELGLLNDRRTAFQEFARRVGSGGAKSFATAMIQAEQYGTGISTALRVMADELRDARMAEAERKAASLPPKLTVPMIVFFLPALFIVILGPAGIQASIARAGG